MSAVAQPSAISAIFGDQTQSAPAPPPQQPSAADAIFGTQSAQDLKDQQAPYYQPGVMTDVLRGARNIRNAGIEAMARPFIGKEEYEKLQQSDTEATQAVGANPNSPAYAAGQVGGGLGMAAAAILGPQAALGAGTAATTATGALFAEQGIGGAEASADTAKTPPSKFAEGADMVAQAALAMLPAHLAGGVAGGLIAKAIKTAAMGMGYTGGSNLANKALVNPDQPVLQGVGTSGAIGAILGPMLPGGTSSDTTQSTEGQTPSETPQQPPRTPSAPPPTPPAEVARPPTGPTPATEIPSQSQQAPPPEESLQTAQSPQEGKAAPSPQSTEIPKQPSTDLFGRPVYEPQGNQQVAPLFHEPVEAKPIARSAEDQFIANKFSATETPPLNFEEAQAQTPQGPQRPRAQVERELLAAYRSSPEYQANESHIQDIQNKLEESGAGTKNIFNFYGKLPGEVKQYLEDNPAAKRLFNVVDSHNKALGSDAFATLGDDYWRLADAASGNTKVGELRDAMEWAERYQDRDPQTYQLGQEYENNPSPTLRGRLRRGQVTMPESVAKFADLDVVPSTNRLIASARNIMSQVSRWMGLAAGRGEQARSAMQMMGEADATAERNSRMWSAGLQSPRDYYNKLIASNPEFVRDTSAPEGKGTTLAFDANGEPLPYGRPRSIGATGGMGIREGLSGPSITGQQGRLFARPTSPELEIPGSVGGPGPKIKGAGFAAIDEMEHTGKISDPSPEAQQLNAMRLSLNNQLLELGRSVGQPGTEPDPQMRMFGGPRNGIQWDPQYFLSRGGWRNLVGYYDIDGRTEDQPGYKGPAYLLRDAEGRYPGEAGYDPKTVPQGGGSFGPGSFAGAANTLKPRLFTDMDSFRNNFENEWKGYFKSQNPADWIDAGAKDTFRALYARQAVLDSIQRGIVRPFTDNDKPAFAIADKLYRDGHPVWGKRYGTDDPNVAQVLNYMSDPLRFGNQMDTLLDAQRSVRNAQMVLGSASHIGRIGFGARGSTLAAGFETFMHGEFGEGWNAIKAAFTPVYERGGVARMGQLVNQEITQPGSTTPLVAQIVKHFEMGGGIEHAGELASPEDWRAAIFGEKALAHFGADNPIGGMIRGARNVAQKIPDFVFGKAIPPIQAGARAFGAIADIMEAQQRGIPMDSAEFRDMAFRRHQALDQALGKFGAEKEYQSRIAKVISEGLMAFPRWTLGKVNLAAQSVADIGYNVRNLRPSAAQQTLGGMIALHAITGTVWYMSTHWGQLPPTAKDAYYPPLWPGMKDKNGQDIRATIPSPLDPILKPALGIETPGEALASRAAVGPSIAYGLAANRDFRGVQTRDTPIDAAKYVAKEALTPMGWGGSQSTAGKVASGLTGYGPAGTMVNDTPARAMMYRIRDAMPREARTPEEADETSAKYAGKPFPLSVGIRSFPVQAAMRVWGAANPDERNEMRNAMIEKINNSRMSAADKQAYLGKLAQ